MIFKKLKLKNIRSYEELEIEFPEGSILLAGDIGSGKTSILLGLQFALFGLQPGQKGSSILRQGTEDAFASLEMEVDGETIILERSIKKNKSGSITQDMNRITRGNSQEEISTSEMKSRVIEILNYPKEFIKKSNLLYKFTVYTPQEEMKAIIQERPEIRLDTLRHIFGIDRYKRIKENSQIFLQKLKEEIQIKEVLISELLLLREKLNQETEKKITLARETNNLEIEVQNFLKQKEISRKKLESVQKLVEEKKSFESEISNLETLIQGKKDLESRLKREIALMQRQISTKTEFSEEVLKSTKGILEKHKSILDEKNKSFLKINSTISVLESKKEAPLKLKENVLSLENCPFCFQLVSQEHKNKIAKRTQFELEDIERELEIKIQEKQKIIQELEREKDLVREYELDKSKLEQNRIKYQHQREITTKIKSDAFVLDRTSNEIRELENRLQIQKTRLNSFSEYNEQFDKAKESFENISEETRKKEISLAEKRRELEIIKIRLEELSGDISKKERTKEEMNYQRSLQNWIKDKFLSMITLTEKNVMAKLRKEFSDIFSEWFSLLVSDSLSVSLDESFTPIIINQDYEIDYEFLSGGERTAVALAYRLSLTQVLNSFLSKIKTKEVVILDEPTDGFSTEQIDKMRDLFEELKTEQLILVSHEQKIEGFVDHVIRIRKDGTSQVE